MSIFYLILIVDRNLVFEKCTTQYYNMYGFFHFFNVISPEVEIYLSPLILKIDTFFILQNDRKRPFNEFTEGVFDGISRFLDNWEKC